MSKNVLFITLFVVLFVAGLLMVVSRFVSFGVLEAVPESGTLSLGEVVYVENNGRCSAAMVIKVTGGSYVQNISRRVECVIKP